MSSPVSFSQSFLMTSVKVVLYLELIPLCLVLGAQLCFLILFAQQMESASGNKKESSLLFCFSLSQSSAIRKNFFSIVCAGE